MPKFLPTFNILSKMGSFFSLLLLAPAVVSYLYQDGQFYTLIDASLITCGISFSLWLLTRRHQRELKAKDGFTLVFLLWLGFALEAAVPFYFAIPQMGFTNAYFEAMSGLTTTGATVIADLDHLPPSINFWRHMLNWLGGMGIIVLAVAILPLLGVGGMQLFRAEVTGINKGQKIAPRIGKSAKNLWLVYVFFTVLIALALKLAGTSWMDAIDHAMSSISSGGFSTHNDSIAYFDSIPIEIILAIGMLLGAISFTNHFFALQNRSLKHYWQDKEVRVAGIILLGSIIIASIYLWQIHFYHFGQAFRYVFFNFISIGVGCGYANTDFNQWPIAIALWMFLLANIIPNSGSTGGGIKMVRVIVLFQLMHRELMRLLHPNIVKTIRINHFTVPDRTALTVLAFVFVYFMSVVLFTFILMFSGMDFISSLSAIVASITNTGPGLGSVGPANNWLFLSDFQKWITLFVMLLGRLEIFTVFILLTPAYWKK